MHNEVAMRKVDLLLVLILSFIIFSVLWLVFNWKYVLH